MVVPLHVDELCNKCDISLFDFDTTADLELKGEIIGQKRALKSISFGVGIKHDGYNLFVMGDSGSGKKTIVEEFINRRAMNEYMPDDICYVNNFEDPRKPIILSLPTGMGVALSKDMDELVKTLQSIIPALFESDEYKTKKQNVNILLKEKQATAFEDIKKRALEESIQVQYTPTGYVISYLKEGKAISPKEYQAFDEKIKEEIQKKIGGYKDEIDKVSTEAAVWIREAQEEIQELEHNMTQNAVGHTINALKEKYKDYEKVIGYLKYVEKDVVEYAQDFLPAPEAGSSYLESGLPKAYKDSPSFSIYSVNLIVHHKDKKGAPIVYEDNPTYFNLFGRIEHISHMGTLITDFNLIKPGALHQANGGYLILDARKVLMQPFVWEGLKRMLRSKKIRIESLEEALSLTSSLSLEPETVDLDIKVVLIGERYLYYLLYNYDPEFKELFKIDADFEERMDRSDENILLYAKTVGELANKNHLFPLDKQAVAKVIEYSSRLTENRQKLTTQFHAISDLLIEADFIAKERDSQLIQKSDIEQAVAEKIERSDRVKDRLYESVEKETILIKTKGEAVGQVNGLSVLDLGNYSFGMPVKITARTRFGKGGVINIEREVKLSGAIHSKGVMILSSFLASQYAKDFPLTLSASLVFEQSYSKVDGDSASSAELFALLSSLSELPIKQSFAVTGSVNQNGQIQAVGGINEKIEGFFDICKIKNEFKKNGVIIPYSNIKHLMLKNEVLEAVEKGEFEIYGIKDVYEGIKILTGKESIDYLIEKKLKDFASKAEKNKG